MKAIQFLLIFTFLLTNNYTADAQFGRLQRKLERKINQKLDKKVDEAVDEVVDEVIDDALEGDGNEETNADGTAKKKRSRFDLSNIGSGEVNLEDQYHYEVKVDWEVTSEGEKPTSMSQLMTKEGEHFAMVVSDGKKKKKKQEEMTMIFDLKNQHLVMLQNSEQQAMVTSLNFLAQPISESVAEQQEGGKFTATGKSKQIMGYTCTQYLFSSEESNGEMWVTKDLKYANRNLFAYMQQIAKKSDTKNPQGWEMLKDGFALETKSTDKKGKVSTMTVTAIDENTSVNFQMSNYQVINLSGFMGGASGN